MGIRESSKQIFKNAFESIYKKPFNEMVAERIQQLAEANNTNDKIISAMMMQPLPIKRCLRRAIFCSISFIGISRKSSKIIRI